MTREEEPMKRTVEIGFPRLYIQAINIDASMYAQKKLSEKYGFKILREGNIPHESDRFLVCGPPEYCQDVEWLHPRSYWKWNEHKKDCQKCQELLKDKPVICSVSEDRDDIKWINLFDALKLIALTEIGPPVDKSNL